MCDFALVKVSVVIVFEGPGLAVRVICAEEPYLEKDFAETSLILKLIVDYANAVKKVFQFLKIYIFFGASLYFIGIFALSLIYI